MNRMNPFLYMDEHRDEIVRTYEDLHQLAEPSWHEEKTARYLRERLEAAGIAVTRFEGHHGFYAEIPGKNAEIVALRADMDALVQEVDGVVRPNHSCGHDAHSTLALYSALAIQASGAVPPKTMRFLFQPAEEKMGGALQMMKDGALEGVTKLIGVHLRPEMEVPYGSAAPAILHGSSSSIRGTITGLQAHGARPALGKNVIEAASFLVQALQNIRLQDGCSFSVKMTQLQAGGETVNVIPDRATFSLDVRAQSNEGMAELRRKTEHAMSQTGALMGMDVEWEWSGVTPAAVANANMIQVAQKAIGQVLGEDKIADICVTPGGEDFHFYAIHRPELATTMIGLGCGLTPVLHHPQMTFQTDALIYGAKIMTAAIYEAAQHS